MLKLKCHFFSVSWCTPIAIHELEWDSWSCWEPYCQKGC